MKPDQINNFASSPAEKKPAQQKPEKLPI